MILKLHFSLRFFAKAKETAFPAGDTNWMGNLMLQSFAITGEDTRICVYRYDMI